VLRRKRPPEEPAGEPDEVTEAALEAVTEAAGLADEQVLEGRVIRRRRRTGRLSRRPRGDQNEDQGVRRLGAAIGHTARRSAHTTGRGFSIGGKWLSSQVLALAPRLPVRDLAALRAQFPDRSPDDLASALIEGAARASAAVGVAVGAWAVLPFPPAAGVEIATRTWPWSASGCWSLTARGLRRRAPAAGWSTEGSTAGRLGAQRRGAFSAAPAFQVLWRIPN
jgi:hypothetical protein